MPIPEFQEFHLPVLKQFSEGVIISPSDLESYFADYFKLNEEERKELLPSGKQRRLLNRINWSLYDLFRAGLLDRPKKGKYLLSKRGQEILNNPPSKIDREYLNQFAEFRKWQAQTSSGSGATSAQSKNTGDTLPNEVDDATPEEIVGKAMSTLAAKLKGEVLDLTKAMDPLKFEQLVLDLMLKMGYGGAREGAGQLTQASNDGGIDGLINEDKLGLDVIYLQAKRYIDGTIGRPKIQEFVGALAGKQANKGVFITTSAYSQGAIDYANAVQQKIILIDGERLAELMIEHNLGVAVETVYEVKRIDSDFFEQD
ncbi:restriction endonuclease [Cerasicoccus frondis]|uniref:restriction endonuclease n=1 Tax=Cerasicoccus frondis TaxID=490090 RepID=UPI0028529B46|nr:restriction endonuclease [Cerasicoccus frondis]